MAAELSRPSCSRLCDVCKSFGLKKEDFHGIYSNDGRRIDLDDTFNPGYLIEVRKRTSCPLCRLIVRAVEDCSTSSIKDERFYEVRLKWPFVDKGRNLSVPWVRPLNVSCLIWNLPPGERNLHDDREVRFNQINILNEHVPPNIDPLRSARRVAPSQVDIEQVKIWLTLCSVTHGPACQLLQHSVVPEQESDWFWLVDVEQRCIVKAPPGYEWVALSYNWGAPPCIETTKGTFHDLQKPGALRDCDPPLPATISDAIVFVGRLGLRHLWVDRFCIVQDDPEMIEAAMVNMSLIYANARLTIVAASGNTAEAGLPGVRPGTRNWTQAVEEIEPGFSLLTGRTPTLSFPNLRYNTRAWTYQEYILSNRRVVFYEGMMFFQCRQALWREDSVDEDPFAIPSREPIDFFSSLHIKVMESDVASPIPLQSNPDVRNILSSYAETLSSYTARSLSFQSDVIRAYYSIIDLLCRRMHSDMFFGMPVLVFDWALLFRDNSAEGLQRRPQFPSWSWCGWIGKVQLPPTAIAAMTRLMFQQRFVEWSYLDPWTGKDVFLFQAPKLGFLGQDSKSRYFNYSAAGLKFSILPSNLDMSRLPKTRNVNFDDRDKPSSQIPSLFERRILMTWGIVAYFYLATANRQYQPENVDLFFLGKKRRPWALFDRNKVWSGFFYPHQNIDTAYSKTLKIPILLLSAADAFDEDERVKRFRQYEQMVLKRNQSNSGMYMADVDNLLQNLISSAERIRALTLHEEGEDDYLRTFKSATRFSWEFASILGLTPYERSMAFESCGVGWIFKKALANTLDPGLVWRKVILV